MFNAPILRASFVKFGKLSEDRTAVVRAIIAELGDPVTYETFEAARMLFGEVKRAANPAVTDNAVNVAWASFSRACTEFAVMEGFDFTWPAKPKATTPEAERKAKARVIPEAVTKATTVAELAAVERPADAIEAAKLESLIASKKLSLVKAEAKKEMVSQNEGLKARRAALVEKIKHADLLTLCEFEAMANHDAAGVLNALPLLDVQKALAKLLALQTKAPKAANLQALAAKAPKQAQAPRKAKVSA